MFDPEDKHAPAIYAVWHDPTTYDHLKMGPPYLPGSKTAKAAGRQKLSSEQLRPVADVLLEARSVLQALNPAVRVEDYGNQPMAWLSALLSWIRGANFIHLTHHWQSKGPSSYEDHLMFERIYNATLPLVDKLAERTVGLGNPVLVDPVIQANHQFLFIQGLYGTAPSEMSQEACIRLSLTATYGILSLIPIVRNALSQESYLTPGVDNLLQGIADSHEEFAYLLKQRLGG